VPPSLHLAGGLALDCRRENRDALNLAERDRGCISGRPYLCRGAQKFCCSCLLLTLRAD
jgi:hypothetical protein